MRRVLVSIAIVLSFTAISLSAQDLPSPQEMERILIEGPDWKAYKIKYQILDKQSKVDSTSIDYQLCNLFLWSIYQKLEDKESENKVTQSLYSFLKSGGYDRLQGFIIANYPEETAITQQGNIALIMGQYESAEESYLHYLSLLSDEESIHFLGGIDKLAQIYSAGIKHFTAEKDYDKGLSLYSKACTLFSKYPVPASRKGYMNYFAPWDNQLKELIAIIPSERVKGLCESVINLNQIIDGVELRRGIISKEDSIKHQVFVMKFIANDCYYGKHYCEAKEYCGNAIEIIRNNDSIQWDNLEGDLRFLLSIANEESGNWKDAVLNRLESFKCSLRTSGHSSEETKSGFNSAKLLIDIALEAGVSFVNSIRYDESHPHLSYEDNMLILSAWRDCLRGIKDQYGDLYLKELRDYCLLQRSNYAQDVPLFTGDKLSFLSESWYTECRLNIMADRLTAFTSSYQMLLDNIVPNNEKEDANQIRYELVKSLAESLIESGYYEWGINVLDLYHQYLVSEGRKDYETDEKIITELGYFAWEMGDLENLAEATSKAHFVVFNGDKGEYNNLYYDANELISQLILLARLYQFTDVDKSREILMFAKDLVSKNITLSNGSSLTSQVKASLYNELATFNDNPQERIPYLEQAIKEVGIFDYAYHINLGIAYAEVGEYDKSNSVLLSIYQASKDNYMQPRWKREMFKTLIGNAIKMNNYVFVKNYSLELLATSIEDYLNVSKSLTSQERSNYWDINYSRTLVDASSVDLACGNTAVNSFNAALFQKSILLRQKQAIKKNILQSDDLELKRAFERYNKEIRSSSDSALITESYCMYLYSLHPEFAESFSIPDWKDVATTLKKSDLAIEYSIAYDPITSDKCFVALLLRHNYETPLIVRLCKYEDLLSSATALVDINGFSRSLYEDGTTLYQLLWAPIEDYLKGVKAIYYSLYDYLNNVNIEIATQIKGGKTIGEEFKVYRVSSTADLASRNDSDVKRAVIFGDIDYNAKISSTESRYNIPQEDTDYSKLRGSMGGGSWDPTPETKSEMEYIQKRLKEKGVSTIVCGAEQGTEEVFKSLSSNAPDILHMATHGFYFSEKEALKYDYFTSDVTSVYNPGIRSGLVLSGGNHAWNGEDIPSGAEDGILNADEISGMDLTGTQILTLSACQTALGDLVSDGVYGMQRSFKVSGVNTIIMSLWKVNDEATKILMTRFYENLVKGKGKYVSFHEAQNYLRNYSDKDHNKGYFDKPEFYAAFVLLDAIN